MYTNFWSDRFSVCSREQLPMHQILPPEIYMCSSLILNGTWHFEKRDIRVKVLGNIEIPLPLQINYAQDLEPKDR
ncbi:hypothetical protein LC612_31600 [Nostoc sp. CHAB 5834]|nr:hypothetical protein [Nostoc sp. CHAB 5834]